MSDQTQKFTPGPWTVRVGHDVTGYPCYFLCGFSGDAKRDTAMHEANARLIAAAPDYHAAVASAMQDASELEYDDAGYVAIPKEAWGALVAAHAKAEADHVDFLDEIQRRLAPVPGEVVVCLRPQYVLCTANRGYPAR